MLFNHDLEIKVPVFVFLLIIHLNLLFIDFYLITTCLFVLEHVFTHFDCFKLFFRIQNNIFYWSIINAWKFIVSSEKTKSIEYGTVHSPINHNMQIFLYFSMHATHRLSVTISILYTDEI